LTTACFLQQVSETHLNQLGLILLRQINDFKQIEDALLQMGHLLAHQVIELPRLEHVLNGVAHLYVLLVVGLVADLL
jgi:hypothetical protein